MAGGDTTRTPIDRGPDRGVGRPVGNSLTVVGTFLIVIGAWSILRAVGLLPDAFAEVVGDWWGLALVLGGGWMFWHGRRATGAVLMVVGALNLTFTLVPGRLLGPVLLIGAGIVLVTGAMGGRRWFGPGAGAALFDEVLGPRFRDRSTRSIVAIFNEAERAIDASFDARGVVECLAVFGDVKVTVPHDVVLELRQTAVFGDVRAPEPPIGTTVATVQVRATAVFGDVRLIRR